MANQLVAFRRLHNMATWCDSRKCWSNLHKRNGARVSYSTIAIEGRDHPRVPILDTSFSAFRSRVMHTMRGLKPPSEEEMGENRVRDTFRPKEK